jgi:hypothetical protein
MKIALQKEKGHWHLSHYIIKESHDSPPSIQIASIWEKNSPVPKKKKKIVSIFRKLQDL